MSEPVITDRDREFARDMYRNSNWRETYQCINKRIELYAGFIANHMQSERTAAKALKDAIQNLMSEGHQCQCVGCEEHIAALNTVLKQADAAGI